MSVVLQETDQSRVSAPISKLTELYADRRTPFSSIRPIDVIVCPGRSAADHRLVSFLGDQIDVFTNKLADMAQTHSDLFTLRFTSEEAEYHRNQFKQAMKNAYGVASIYGKVPESAFAIYGALPLAHDTIRSLPEANAHFHPIFMESHVKDGIRKVSVNENDKLQLSNTPILFVDHVIRSGNTLGQFMKSLFPEDAVPASLEKLLSFLEERQMMPAELLEKDMEELVQILEEHQVVVATPYIKNPVLRRLLSEQATQSAVSEPWGKMQKIFTDSMVELDEFATPLGASMWDIGVEPEELRHFLPEEVSSMLDSLGFYNIRLLRLSGSIPQMYEIHVEDIEDFKKQFAGQIVSYLDNLRQNQFGIVRPLRINIAFTGNGRSNEVQPLKHIPAIIMCGGLGIRLKEETGDEIPKSLVPIDRSTVLIESPLAQLEYWGASPIILATSKRDVDNFRHLFKRNHKHVGHINYSVEDEAKGVIGAVLQAMDLYGLNDKYFILSHADEIVQGVDLLQMREQHKRSNAGVTLIATTHPDAGNNYVGWVDHHHKLTHIERNPPKKDGGLTMTGFFIFSPGVFRRLAENAADWNSLVYKALATGQLYAYESTQGFYNVNTPGELQRLRILYARGNILFP